MNILPPDIRMSIKELVIHKLNAIIPSIQKEKKSISIDIAPYFNREFNGYESVAEYICEEIEKTSSWKCGWHSFISMSYKCEIIINLNAEETPEYKPFGFVDWYEKKYKFFPHRMNEYKTLDDLVDSYNKNIGKICDGVLIKKITKEELILV